MSKTSLGGGGVFGPHLEVLKADSWLLQGVGDQMRWWDKI